MYLMNNIGKSGRVVMPVRGSETFISMIGHLDGRIDLYRKEILTSAVDEVASMEGSFQAESGSRMLMDLCILASKLAYENAKVVKNVVNLHWKVYITFYYFYLYFFVIFWIVDY